jgi:hypothetical protein
MHRDPWIPAEDRTKVFRLFGCSLSPLANFRWELIGYATLTVIGLNR